MAGAGRRLAQSRGPKGLKRERFVSEQEFHRATSFLQGFELPPEGGSEHQSMAAEHLVCYAAQVNANRICIRILTRLG